MRRYKREKAFFVFTALPPVLAVCLAGCGGRQGGPDLSVYRYRDTRNLVSFVYDASRTLEKDGEKGLEYFRNNRQKFRKADYYLYVYDLKGTNVFHSGMNHLEGRNLWDIADRNGKKITQLTLEALEDEDNPHAWVHYSWWEPGKFYPVPKSSCNFKVKTPEGDEYLVGGGMNYPHEEQEFIRIAVDGAVRLLKGKGVESLALISDPASKFNYRDVSVFAFRPDGEMLISPAIKSAFSQTNLLECVDESGHRPFAKALKTLESAERTWEIFMAKSRYKRDLSKKCLYIHRTRVDGADIFVAAITDLPEPPY